MKISVGIRYILLKVSNPVTYETRADVKLNEIKKDIDKLWTSTDFISTIPQSEILEKYFPELNKMRELRSRLRGRMGSIICG